jgi:hypothetical protein
MAVSQPGVARVQQFSRRSRRFTVNYGKPIGIVSNMHENTVGEATPR